LGVVNNEASDLEPDEKEKIDKLEKESKGLFAAAIPYLEKAHQLKPDDINTLSSLKQLYMM
jgi:hypothetical protein